jgi:hypothetical protein
MEPGTPRLSSQRRHPASALTQQPVENGQDLLEHHASAARVVAVERARLAATDAAVMAAASWVCRRGASAASARSATGSEGEIDALCSCAVSAATSLSSLALPRSSVLGLGAWRLAQRRHAELWHHWRARGCVRRGLLRPSWFLSTLLASP